MWGIVGAFLVAILVAYILYRLICLGDESDTNDPYDKW